MGVPFVSGGVWDQPWYEMMILDRYEGGIGKFLRERAAKK